MRNMKCTKTQTCSAAFFILALFVANLSPVFAATAPALLDPRTIPKFENQLTGPPPVYEPTVTTDSTGKTIHEYTVTMSSFEEQMLPPSMGLITPVWGYGGLAKDAVTGAPLGFVQGAPGPSFESERGIPSKVKWVNNITSQFMLPVDPTLHWANPNNIAMPSAPFQPYPPGYPEAQTTVPLVTHLHGSETESGYDGSPDEWFTANGTHGPTYSTYESTEANSAVYYYPNQQPSTTLWYHDHALGLTRINVMSGLAGFYLLRDSNSSSDAVAPSLPPVVYEVPLVIQDRTFYADGSMWFPTVGNNPDAHPYWFDAFLGNTIVVNGKVWPNMNVSQGQYRFRLLDASNSRFYFFSFVNTQTNATIPFIQIGSDGGYLKSPVTMENLTMGPAERADILVDFSGLPPGTTVLLKNSGLTGGPSEEFTVGQIMQFTVTANAGFKPNTLPVQLNPTLAGSTFPNLPNPTKTRILTLFRSNGPNGPLDMLLNGQSYDGIVSELPVLGSTEDWAIVDLTDGVHPIHLHLVQFQIVSRQTVNATSYAADWIALQRQALGIATAVPPWPTDFVPKELPVEPYLIGSPTPPPPNEQGWKDTVITSAFEVTVIRVRFTSQDGSPYPLDATQGPGYVWHCHILDHEDNEMMRPYKVVAAVPQSQNTIPPIVFVPIILVIIAVILAVLFLQRRKRRLKRIEA